MNPLDYKSANDAQRTAEPRRSCTGQPCWLATLNGETNDCPVHGDADDEVVFASGDGAA